MTGFSPPDLAAWRQEVQRLLKGDSFERSMVTELGGGLAARALYTAADTADLPWAESMPGQAPHLRGARAAGYKAAPWWISQEAPYPTCQEFNSALRHDLERGQTAVNLVLDHACRKGLDPDQSAVGHVGSEGTSVASLGDLTCALAGVDLGSTPILLESGSGSLPVAALLMALVRRTKTDPRRLQGCLGCDPVYGLGRAGQIPLTLSRTYDELALLTRWVQANSPGMRTLPVFEAPWHDGGADCALSLGLTLAVGVHVLRAMEEREVPVEQAAARLQFNLTVGSDFFLEIAKLRALRLLWSDILTAAGCPADMGAPFIHANTSLRTMSLLDPQVNILRTTTQAMAAVLGGVASLNVRPFTAAAGPPEEFSRRVARNLQLILKHESHLDQVLDPAGGSWYIESLTRDLGRQSWEIFQEIERQGGIVQGMRSGWVQERIGCAAELRQQRLAVGKEVLIGTNKYPLGSDLESHEPPIDFAQHHARRKEEVARTRTPASPEDHLLILGSLERVLDSSPDVLMESLISAADKGATLGELVEFLHQDVEPEVPVVPVASVRDAEPFEKIVMATSALSRAQPTACRVFLACLGDPAPYGSRLGFARSFFQVGGFGVVEEGFFTDPKLVPDAVTRSGARVVVLVGLDKTYGELAVPTAQALAGQEPPPLVMLAGRPEDLVKQLEDAGVREFIHLRSDVPAVLGRLLTELRGEL